MNARTKSIRVSGAESRLQTIASRNASKQLFRLPWSRFRNSYERYPRWQALALWGEAIIRIAGCVPPPVLTTVAKHCPGFVEANDNWEQSPAFHLLEWVHANRFSNAKKEGWLDALIFYGVRHPASRAVWTYFEKCEEQWSRGRPASLPSFDRWWRLGQRAPLDAGPSCRVITGAVESFIEWKAFTFWLRPLFFGSIGLPPDALSEMESRCPELVEFSKKANAIRRPATRAELWRRIIGICQDRAASRAKREGWLGILLEQVASYPLYVRTHAYAAHWKQEWNRRRPPAYPSLAKWKEAAAEYIDDLDRA
ncbi:MAG: hypothetical protein ACRD8A_00130 [Candidatus Acidiferrales bacterium]